MITRGEVEKVVRAFAKREWEYWQENYDEWMCFATHPKVLREKHTIHASAFDRAVMWDGFHWHYVRCLVQGMMWQELYHYLFTMGETHLREQMQTLIESTSPHVYKALWEIWCNRSESRNDTLEII